MRGLIFTHQACSPAHPTQAPTLPVTGHPDPPSLPPVPFPLSPLPALLWAILLTPPPQGPRHAQDCILDVGAGTHRLSSPMDQAWAPHQLREPGSHPMGQLGALKKQQASRGPQRPV